MHLLPTDARSLDAAEAAVDLARELGQEKGEAAIVVLSFTDADLALAAAPDIEGVVCAPLARLRHPMSVDLYLEAVCRPARAILVRLLGGPDYWRYGIEELAALARTEGIALAVLPGDGRDDSRLGALSTVSGSDLARLGAYWRWGGAANVAASLRGLAALAGLDRGPAAPPRPVPMHGVLGRRPAEGAQRGRALVVFYRSILLADDLAPVHALVDALAGRGLTVSTLFVGSLKETETDTWMHRQVAALRPDVIVNLTAFSAAGEAGGTPLDGADCPVLQAVTAGSRADAWAASSRGLSATDLAMHVALPELDGRLLAGAISFKAELYGRTVHEPYPDGIAAVADRAAAWVRLRATPAAERRVALVLSNYPGAGRLGHAVGLDTPASALAIVDALAGVGYGIEDRPRDAAALMRALEAVQPTDSYMGDAASRSLPHEAREGAPRRGAARVWSAAATEPELTPAASPLREMDTGERRPPRPIRPAPPATFPNFVGKADGEGGAFFPLLPLTTYRAWLAAQPSAAQSALASAWGDPADDPACDGVAFAVSVLLHGHLALAVQPDRGDAADVRADHHSPDRPPRHAYLAFHLWLRTAFDAHAVVHLGTHGTLEWLPGKAAALSAACFPAVALGALPVLYPFIVNNPGEAAQAKRRLGAVTIGHMTPPLAPAGLSAAAVEVERLIDEYAGADGLDPRRMRLLRQEIVVAAGEAGLLADCGAEACGEDEALARLDAFLCDVKETQIRDGLHVFGCTPPAAGTLVEAMVRGGGDPASMVDLVGSCGPAEMAGLLAGLDGRFVHPGPSGAPTRGRPDVLPTGRNLAGLDPRAIPTRAAFAIGARAAQEILRRYRQDHGDDLRTLVLDLWGSATLRTGGDTFGTALALLGVRPVWDAASNRVSGYEVLPVARLEAPRVDVTLRISGFFRDGFATQLTLFDEAVRAVAGLDEADAWNPLAAARRAGEETPLRLFGPAPGAYGSGIAEALARGDWERRDDLGLAYLSASAHAYGVAAEGNRAEDAFAARVAAAQAHVHPHDHAESDVLEDAVAAGFQGGFSAALSALGGRAALYNADLSAPEAPRLRSLAEEVARLVGARAANPRWIAGMRRHGYRGAAELATTVDALVAYAATTDAVSDAAFDRLHAAYCGDEAVWQFLVDANPAAAGAIRARFAEALRRGLWHPASNSAAALLADAAE